MVKPKVGLLLLTAEWFRQIGADHGSFAGLGAAVKDDAARICAAIEPHIDVVDGGLIDSTEAAAQAAKRMLAEGVVGVIACNVTWGEDRLLLEAIRLLHSTPLLLWCYAPFARLPERMDMCDLLRASGPVGALQASGALKRLDRRFTVAVGSLSCPSAVSDVVSFSRGAQIAHDLKHLRIGVLPYRCDQMTATYVDEFRLRKDIGPELVYISVDEYHQACEAVSQRRVDDYVSYLKSAFGIAPSVTQEGLARSARATLGLADLAGGRSLGAIALEDVSPELHRVLGLRPCLYSPELAERTVISMEADICGAISIWVLRALTGRPAMYSEMFTFDEAENHVLLGHAGMHDVALANSFSEVLIEPDGEYREGERHSCWMSFRVRPGPVTLLSTFCDVDKFKFVISQGESLPGDRKLLGSPHACIAIDQPVAAFFSKVMGEGMTQHWGMVHGHVMRDLRALGRILNVNTVIV